MPTFSTNGKTYKGAGYNQMASPIYQGSHDLSPVVPIPMDAASKLSPKVAKTKSPKYNGQPHSVTGDKRVNDFYRSLEE